MTSADAFGHILRRHFVAIATADYDDPHWEALPGVAAEVRMLLDWLSSPALGQRRFQHRFPELAASPAKAEIRAALEEPDPEWTGADALFLFVTGHGERADDTHYLVLRRTRRARWKSTALATPEIIGWLAETSVEHLLVILDVCFAGRVFKDILRLDRELPSGWVIMGSATKNQQAVVGVLTTAVGRFLRTLNSPVGGQYGEHVHAYLPVARFYQYVQEELGHEYRLPSPYARDMGPHVCLPNPHHQPVHHPAVEVSTARHDLALPRADLVTHWDPRARGVASTEQPGWLFTGRAQLIRALIAAATEAPGATVVTGRAGSGKSAVLARLVTLSDEQFRARHAAALARVPVDLCPPTGAVDVAILATGKLHTQVLAQLGEACEVPLPATAGPEPTVDERLAAWHAWLAGRATPPTVVIDALEEAADPHRLIEQVLARLEPTPHRPRIRLLVGVRSPGGPNDPAPAPPWSGLSLAELTERALRAHRIRVDEPPWWQQQDLIDYAQDILLHTPESPYLEANEVVAASTTAAALAERAGRSFLVVRIAAGSLAARRRVIAVDDPAWLAALNQGVTSVFRDDLHDSLPDLQDRRRAVMLLRAVAHAAGQGLPWRRTWPPVASAVDSERSYGDSDVAWLLESRLGAYLVTDVADGVTVYRLFHDLLAVTVRERWQELLASADAAASPPAGPAEIRAVHARIADELRRLAHVPATTRCELPPPAYVRHHLPQHAYQGGVLDLHHLPPSFLPFVDLSQLRDTLGSAPPDPHTTIRFPLLPVLWQITHLWRWDRPARNAAALQLWAALNQLPLTVPTGGPWQVQWAVRSPDHSIVLGAHPGGVWAVAVAQLPDGRTVAVTGGDHDLRVWDIGTGVRTRGLAVPAGATTAVATAVLPDQRVVVLAAGDDSTVRIWDLAAGALLGELATGHTSTITAVTTATLPDRRVLALTASQDGTVRTWVLPGREAGTQDLQTKEPATATPPAAPRVDHRTVVTSLATTSGSGSGHVVALSGSADGEVRAWDLATGTPIHAPLSRLAGTAPDRHVAAFTVAAARLPDREHPVVVTAGRDATLRIGDLATGATIAQVPTRGAVTAVATGQAPDGRSVAVTGSNGENDGNADEKVQFWDLANAVPISPPLAGHTGTITAATVTVLPGGRWGAVTGSRDGTVRIWEHDEHRAGRPEERVGTVESVATATLAGGRVVVVAAADDAALRCWDLRTGEQVGRSVASGPSTAMAVATAALADGRVVGIAGAWDATVLVWDLTSGEPVGSPARHHRGPVSHVATAHLPGGQAVAVTGGWDARFLVWDLATGELIGDLPAGRRPGRVAAATATLPNGRAVAVTSDRDHALRCWDLTTGVAAGEPVTAPSGAGVAVTALTTATLPDGRAVAVTSDRDHALRCWDLTTGVAAGEPVTGLASSMTALATATLPDGRMVVIGADEHRLVRVWDLLTAVPAGEALPVPGAVRSLTTHPGSPPWLAIGGAGLAVVRLLHSYDQPPIL